MTLAASPRRVATQETQACSLSSNSRSGSIAAWLRSPRFATTQASSASRRCSILSRAAGYPRVPASALKRQCASATARRCVEQLPQGNGPTLDTVAAVTEDPERSARAVLAELEERLATHDLDQIVDFFTEDVVLIGDAQENFDRDTTVAYLRLMADMTPTVRWEWNRVAVVLNEPGVLSFSAAGLIGFHDSAGQLLGDREPFRVTCLAVQQQGGWRLKHFHGSRPSSED
jgi:uncharacterized protein (TIGR02246 family)